jgi:quercetin dioxygenase-like cupin family protein
MYVVNIDNVSKTPLDSKLFTSKEVSSQQLIPDSADYNISVINFGKGVRNKFHTHDSEQILIIIKGKGIVATEKEEKSVSVGDIVLFPAGEKHWHGATASTTMSHIAIAEKLDGKAVDWMEKVTDQQYQP